MELRHWARQWLLAIAVLPALSGFAPALAQSDDLAALNRQIGQLYQAGQYDARPERSRGRTEPQQAGSAVLGAGPLRRGRAPLQTCARHRRKGTGAGPS